MKKCKFLQNINKRDGWIEARFYGVFQYSTILKESFMVGGLSGGVIAYPVAIEMKTDYSKLNCTGLRR